MVVANSVQIKGSHIKDHHTKVSHPTRNLIMGSNIMAKPIQDNLEAHKDNPPRDNLRPIVVRPLHILGNLLETRDNLTHSKDNLEPSKDTLLGRVVSLTCSKANPLLSLVSHLVCKDNPRFHKDNQTPNKLNLLGK